MFQMIKFGVSFEIRCGLSDGELLLNQPHPVWGDEEVLRVGWND